MTNQTSDERRARHAAALKRRWDNTPNRFAPLNSGTASDLADASMAMADEETAEALRISDEATNVIIAARDTEITHLRAEAAALRASAEEGEAALEMYGLWQRRAEKKRRQVEQLRARVAELEQQAVASDPSITERVLAVCAQLPPSVPGSQDEAVAHCKGWNDAMDAVTAAFRPSDFDRSPSQEQR